ncbi:MAG: peptide chain release factor 1 [Candidatus Coatesbacteria bacterium]|nr:MAG: peptide chain release factor 1 [Candidatus Coatesbacteria bacterium]
MLERIEALRGEYDEIGRAMSDPATASDRRRMAELGRRYNELEEIISAGDRLRAVVEEKEGTEPLLHDGDHEVREMAREEVERLLAEETRLADEIRALLLPKDPNDSRSVIMEIRAGTGGDESALFAADLFRMYNGYAESRKWKVDVMNSAPTEIGGFKEVVFGIDGEGAYSRLKYESGVHRVQRVPETESQGRIHTSAATVAVLPEADELEVEINGEDIEMDVFRSSGPGGQSVNTTDSAVRLTHKPTGIVVTCQDERSQHKNRAKAMRILQARILQMTQEAAEAERAEERRSMVGSGDRSERIRTYNFPQGRISDHRINLTLYNLKDFLAGELDEVIDALADAEREESLAASGV